MTLAILQGIDSRINILSMMKKLNLLFPVLLSVLFACSEENIDPQLPDDGDDIENIEDDEEIDEDNDELTLSRRILNDMVNVLGGTFVMGQTTSGLQTAYEFGTRAESDAEDTNEPRPDELPLHNVTLSDYQISKYEVTQELWEKVMGTIEPCWSESDPHKAMDGVSWQDAMNFIDRLNSLTGGDYRLPTEAEWEYAARGGHLSRDFRYSGSNDWSEVAWCKLDEVAGVQQVGLKQPNELGLYDMSGNAFEWCYDWYGTYSPEDQVNPKGPSDDEKEYSYAGSQVSTHVLRGGHFQSSVLAMRVSFRTKIPTTNYKPKCGFRIARGIPYSEMNNYSPGGAGTTGSALSFSKESGTFAGKTLNYRKAEIGNAEKPALCLYLHGGSSRGNDNEAQLKEKAVRTISAYLQDRGIASILLVPQCDSGGSWGGMMREPLKKLLEAYSGECGKIYCFGGSMGGTGTWALVSYCPGFFTSAMPVAGNPSGCDAASVATTRICTVMGTADNLMSIDNVTAFLEEVDAAGGVFRFEAEDGWSHATTCEESYTEERLDWIFGNQ